jgi:hypothetical protein
MQAELLGCFPLKDRFGSCALTCRALQAAAIAATHEFTLPDLVQQHADAVTSLIVKHSNTHKHVSMKGAWGEDDPDLALPWDNLNQLLSLQLQKLIQSVKQPGNSSEQAGSSNSSNPFTALTALTQLVVESCDAPGCGVHVTQLSALSALQHLELRESAISKGCFTHTTHDAAAAAASAGAAAAPEVGAAAAAAAAAYSEEFGAALGRNFLLS